MGPSPPSKPGHVIVKCLQSLWGTPSPYTMEINSLTFLSMNQWLDIGWANFPLPDRLEDMELLLKEPWTKHNEKNCCQSQFC